MEVSGKLIENLQLDLAELNGYIADSKRTNIKLQLEMIRTTLSKQLEDEKKKQEVLKTTLEQPKQVIKSEPVYLSITKYAFENSKDVVKVYLTDFPDLKAHPKEKILSNFKARSFEVKILDYKGKNYKIYIGNLNKDIKPEDSSFRQTNTGLVISLKKDKDEFWDNLEKKPSLIKERDDKDKEKDPGASLMDMMKDMYNSGDDNMKKIIAESWTKAQNEKTSGGKSKDKFNMGDF